MDSQACMCVCMHDTAGIYKSSQSSKQSLSDLADGPAWENSNVYLWWPARHVINEQTTHI